MGTSSESRANASPLLSAEIAWRDRYEMLESHGYRLRPRYHPNWRPSWLDTRKPVSHHEDYNIHNNLSNMDATRVSDGRKVFLKRVRTVDEVVEFMRQLLQGLCYMHELNVAHRDCSELNLMVDAEAMHFSIDTQILISFCHW
ncbi:hypothetical protein ACEPAG_3764 [Sanghuangporus baumii]